MHELRERSRNPAVAQTLRATTAATLAYVVALQLSSERAPLTAPLTALLVVQVTLFATVKMGIRRVVAVVVGVLLAISFSSLVGLRWWSLCAIILLALVVGRLVRVNEFVNEVAISAMLILGVAGSPATAWARVLDTLIGAVVGLLFNLLFVPPVWVSEASSSIQDMARRMRQLLLQLSETLGGPASAGPTGARLEEARRLDLDVSEVDESLRQAEDSLRFNPRVRERLLTRIALRTGLDTLEVCAVILRALARSMSDLADKRRHARTLVPEQVAPTLQELLAHLGGALVSFSVVVTSQAAQNAEDAELRLATELEHARDSRETVARLLLDHVWDDPKQWHIFGSLLAMVDRTLEELAPENRTERLMTELDQHTRKQRDRFPRLSRMLHKVRSRSEF